jgi:hypothetical protein
MPREELLGFSHAMPGRIANSVTVSPSAATRPMAQAMRVAMTEIVHHLIIGERVPIPRDCKEGREGSGGNA